jgi:hypothetical protein
MANKQFIDLLDAPYSRRGSYIAFANDNYGENLFGKCSLWLCNCRSIGFAMTNLNADSGYRQIKLEALHTAFRYRVFSERRQRKSSSKRDTVKSASASVSATW